MNKWEKMQYTLENRDKIEQWKCEKLIKDKNPFIEQATESWVIRLEQYTNTKRNREKMMFIAGKQRIALPPKNWRVTLEDDYGYSNEWWFENKKDAVKKVNELKKKVI